ncbi:MAG: 2-C-methyl-D-erythritol 4-phosphate cytidylyltransferase [Psychromonas sp.]|nr:2-C-methyl-D-erythritol 4-phosphate cytidylyltransferase [Psychromonas sp.]
MNKDFFSAVIVAAGVGKRVGTDIPKQYLQLLDRTMIEHSLHPFLEHPKIVEVIVSLAKNDQWFDNLIVSKHPKVRVVIGGKKRVDSVLAALNVIDKENYVLVHDAARPCICIGDIDKLLSQVTKNKACAILGTKVRDTMKRTFTKDQIKHTVERNDLWHALTPQLFPNQLLIDAINQNKTPDKITDEASAMEMAGFPVVIVEGQSNNIKVTQHEDISLAEFFLKLNTKAFI